MTSYDDIMKAVGQYVLIGQSVSMPVPFLRDGDLVDRVFLFSVDLESGVPSEPSAVVEIAADCSSVSTMKAESFFRKSELRAPATELPGVVRPSRSEIKQLYRHARAEVEKGDSGDGARKYADAVLTVSHESLAKYYAALSPELFDGR